MVQDVVPLLASSNLNEFSQEERCTLGNGGQLCDVLGLTLHAADLHEKEEKSIFLPTGRSSNYFWDAVTLV